MTKLIYFAVPIDSVPPGSLNGHRTPQTEWQYMVRDIHAVAGATHGVIGYHPSKAFTVGPDCRIVPSLEAANRAALQECDGLVAIVPKGVQSVGVPREIEAMLAAGKPVAVVTDHDGSFSLSGMNLFEMTIPGIRKAIDFVRDAGRIAISSHEMVFHAVGHGKVPTKAHETDAGLDLYVSETIVIPAGEFRDVPTDIRVAMPPDMWGRIVGRSSTFRRRGLLVIEGVLDAGYRGPVYTGLRNLSAEAVVIERGERISQLIPHVNLTPRLRIRDVGRLEFDALPHDGRGEAGFGSSGS